MHSLNCLTQVACHVFKHFVRFFIQKLKQTVYCLLFEGFPFEVCWFFVIEKWTTSVRDFPFVLIQRKCEEMGNKGFVLVTKRFVLYINSLSGLDCLCTYYWNKESKDWKRFFFLKAEKFIDFMDISFNFVSVWNVWHVSILFNLYNCISTLGTR